MKINAERLAARVHDALTRDFNENHDAQGRFASYMSESDKQQLAGEALRASDVANQASQHLAPNDPDSY